MLSLTVLPVATSRILVYLQVSGNFMFRGQSLAWIIVISVFSFATVPALAQDSSSTTQGAPAAHEPPSGGSQNLQKATQNPVSSLISVPVQNNNNFDIGP